MPAAGARSRRGCWACWWFCRPGARAFHPEGLYRVASALFWSMGVILTRRMTATERAETTMFWSAVTGLVVLTAVIPFHFVAPTAMQLTMSVAQGVFSSVRQWLVILSLRFTPVSTLAPYSYMSLLWMTGAGFLVFGVFPELSTLVGAGGHCCEWVVLGEQGAAAFTFYAASARAFGSASANVARSASVPAETRMQRLRGATPGMRTNMPRAMRPSRMRFA